MQKRVLIAFLVAVSLALLAIPADARKLPNADALARSARKARIRSDDFARSRFLATIPP